MRIDRDYVVEQAKRILDDNKETQAQYLERATKGFVQNVLLQSRDFWKNYGMYWWNVQEILKKYQPRDYRNFLNAVGGEEEIGRDDEMKKEYDYGSDMYNWIAGVLYVQDRQDSMELGDENTHQHATPDGDIRSYMPGVGFVDEREDD